MVTCFLETSFRILQDSYVYGDAINFLIGFDIIKNSEIEEKHSNIQMSIEKIYQEKFDEYVLDLNIKFFEEICKKSTVEIFEKLLYNSFCCLSLYT